MLLLLPFPLSLSLSLSQVPSNSSMADLLLGPLIKSVMQKATDLLVQQVVEMWGIKDQRERLHDKLLAIQAVLADAEVQGVSNPAVKNWMMKLKSAAYDADNVLDEFCYEELRRDAVLHGHKVGNNVSGFFSHNNPALFRYKMGKKLNKVLGRIEELVAEMEKFRFVQGQRVQVVNRVRTDSLVVESKVLGRDKDRQELVNLLLKVSDITDLTVVPVVGMGGVGKTTLAQIVYNDPRVKEHFKLPLWVCVSEEFNIGFIVKSIVELVKRDNNVVVDNMELLQRHLREVLGGKKYILVLDDVWNENNDKWERLKDLLNCGEPGSVVVVTTRSDKVGSIMGTVENYKLGCLSEEDSWILFQRRAFSRGVKECQELVEIGRQMVQNCRGLPLAINTLGSLMSDKGELREWSAILKESNIWEKRPDSDEVLPVLRLSYDHLPPYMKQCFAFCAIYPKDYEMDKDKLIQFWMANGFIPSDETDNIELKGSDIFNELVWRSFLQEVRQVVSDDLGHSLDDFTYNLNEGHCSQTKCKIHDLMHDLAQSIMGGECLSTREVPAQPNRSTINARHISVKIFPIDINNAMDCFPSIQSLILFSQSHHINYVKNIEFLKSNSLRILELHVWPIENTIFTPIKMKHLRYLDLWIGYIKSIPEEISMLYLLKTLRLSDCRHLEKLPDGMRYMSSLRHLYIANDCRSLRSMPEGLGKLNCLHVLTTYVVGTDAGNGIAELKSLNNLHGQLRLYNLRNINHVIDAREANLVRKQNLDNLVLCWGKPHTYRGTNDLAAMQCDPFEVLDALKPCNKLKVLEVALYSGDKLPVWMTEYQMLENLIELYIIDCRECTKIPPVEDLPFLKVLKLKHLDNLTHLCKSASTSAEGVKTTRVAFPSLTIMVLYKMPKLCSWCEGEVGNNTSLTFPELKALEITECPELTTIPIVPSLISLSIKASKNLSCFATGLTTLQNLSLQGHSEDESLSFQPWESLNTLFLEEYNSIVALEAIEREESVTPTKCKELHLIKVSNIPSNTSLWFWKCFSFLESLTISGCDGLIYWPGEEFRCLSCLAFIDVLGCPYFLGSQRESLVERSITEVLLPKLGDLWLRGCPNLVEIPKCSTTIWRLLISNCSKLSCLPEWLGSMVALKHLIISSCKSLNSLPLSIGGCTRLEVLEIDDCPKLAHLPEGMEGLKALEKLEIKKCPKIKVLPKGLLQQLKVLDELWIEGCPHLERYFCKYGKYHHLISKIRLTKIGDGRRSDISKNLAMLASSCKITCFSPQS